MADFYETSPESGGILRYPEHHPPVEYKTYDLLNRIPQEAKKNILDRIPEAEYPLTVLSKIRPGVKTTSFGTPIMTGMPVAVLEGVKGPIFSNYAYFCDIEPDSIDPRRDVLIRPFINIVARFVTQEQMPATMFLGTLRKESERPVLVEKGHESIVDTGGYHVDWADISDRGEPNGKVAKNLVARSVLNLLQNQVKWNPDNAEIAQKYIDDIEQLGWEKVLNAMGNKNLVGLPTKTIKDDSFDTCDQTLIRDERGNFVPRKLDLKKDGLNAIVFRCFNTDGSKFVDLPTSILLSLTDGSLEELLKGNYDIFTWQQSEKIDFEKKDKAPMCNLFITNSFPDENSKLAKYRGNRGRSMGVGIIDLGDNARVLEVGGSHLMIDGMSQSRSLRAFLHDMPKREGVSKKVEFPSFIVYPPLPRVDIGKGNEILQEMSLSDFVVIQEFDVQRLNSALNEFNNLVLVPKTKETKQILIDSGMDDNDAESISRMFTQFLSRSTLIQFVSESFQGKMMNCVPYDEQPYYRMGMSITKSPPDRLQAQLRLGILGKEMDLSELMRYRTDDNLLVSTLQNLAASRMEMVATRKGLPTLGGIQALTHKATEQLKKLTGFIHSKMVSVANQVGFFSDKTSKEDGEVFITAQNHQEQTMGLFIGMLKDKITARVNIEYPEYFNSLDFSTKIDEQVLDKIVKDEKDPTSIINYIKLFQKMWIDQNRDPDNVSKLETVNSMVNEYFTNDMENVARALKLLVVASVYQNIKNTVNTSIVFIEELTKAVKENENKLRTANFI